MNKFSLINDNYKFGDITITREQFLKYKNTIHSIIKELYKNNLIKIDNMDFVKPYSFEKERYTSIINYASTNTTLINWIVKNFNINNYDKLILFVTSNKNELFTENGKYFDETYKILKNTERIGEETEVLAVEFLKSVISNKIKTDIDVLRSSPGSFDDLCLGIDIFFNLNGSKWTCQVKPLVKYQFNDGSYTVESKGNIKKYKTHYLMFVDRVNKKFILFKNKDVKLDYSKLTISEDNYVDSN